MCPEYQTARVVLITQQHVYTVSLKSKSGGEILTHNRWIGGRGCLKKEKCRGGEMFVRWRGECVCVKL